MLSDRLAKIPMKWPDDTENAGSMNHCACCGRPLRGKTKWVHLVDFGESVASPQIEWDENAIDDFGSFPVGPTCAKRDFPGFFTETQA